MNELALFAGAGGGLLGSRLLGWRTVCAVELNQHCRNVLCQRQNDKILETFPIWDDVCTFRGQPWKDIVDVVSGGFPCQDISIAGAPNKLQQGLAGKRSGLWFQFERIIREVKPPFVWVENVLAFRRHGLSTVLRNLAALGYAAEWGVFSAKEFKASHKRERVFILAYNAQHPRFQRCKSELSQPQKFPRLALGKLFPGKEHDLSKPICLGTGHGLANWVDRLKAIGNGQVPIVVEAAWCTLGQRILEEIDAYTGTL